MKKLIDNKTDREDKSMTWKREQSERLSLFEIKSFSNIDIKFMRNEIYKIWEFMLNSINMLGFISV